MNLILLGAPGVGKGTQAKLIAEKYGLPHISTGDIFRANLKGETPLGLKAKEYMDKGLLVPDEVTNEMVKDRLAKEDCKSGYILDGYPRTINQAEFLSGISKVEHAIDFTLDEEEIIKRISGRRTCKNCGATFHILWKPPKEEGVCDKCQNPLVQREDEKPETIKKRLEVYNEQTLPLEEYYRKAGILIEIDASPKIEEIFEEVKKRLE